MGVLKLRVRLKTTLFIILSTVILASLSLYSLGTINADNPVSSGTYVMKYQSGFTEIYLWCDMPVPQAELPELLVENLSITEDQALHIASTSPFNMEGPITIGYGAVEGTTLIGMGQGTLRNITSLSLFTSGPISFETPAYSSSYYNSAPLLPSKDEAKQVADAFILELQQSEAFYPNESQTLTFKNTVAGSSVSVAGLSWVNYWSVVYGLEYNGIPLCGFSRFEVYVGACGSIVGLFSECRNIVPSGKMIKIMITPQEAFEKLQSPYKATPAKINIYNVQLAYFAECALDESGYLRPVYKFSGYMTLIDGTQQSFTSYVDATS